MSHERLWVRRRIEHALSERAKRGTVRKLGRSAASGGVLCTAGERFINFASNDYLGFSHNRQVIDACTAAAERYGSSSASSRLVSGTLPVHEELEAALAMELKAPAALVFSSGYLANLGVVASQARRHDILLLDKLSHASLLDAASLSQAKTERYQHNDLEHLEVLLQKFTQKRVADARVFIVTEAVFSMDGDKAPLGELVELSERFDAQLVVDEAHAIGVLGPSGRGLAVDYPGVIRSGSLGKALASQGGFALVSEGVSELLVNTARSFIYDTALAPSAAAGALAALSLLKSNPERGRELVATADWFRISLNQLGLNTGDSETQIVPLIVGDSLRAMELSELLAEEGFYVPAIRPPTVAEGSARLRFSITSSHKREDLEAVLRVLRSELEHRGGMLL